MNIVTVDVISGVPGVLVRLMHIWIVLEGC